MAKVSDKLKKVKALNYLRKDVEKTLFPRQRKFIDDALCLAYLIGSINGSTELKNSVERMMLKKLTTVPRVPKIVRESERKYRATKQS